MKIVKHRLSNTTFKASPNTGKSISGPKFIVMHYTAGYTAESAISILTSPSSKVSAHVVVDLNGTITQLVPFDVIGWHAGPSSFAGYKGINEYGIGIEIVNIGFLKKTGNVYRDAYGNTVSPDKFEDLVEAKHPRVGSDTYYWPVYPEAQLEAVKELTKLLLEEYPTIEYIVSHEEIDTRGWKTDPGPAFPMKRFDDLLGGGSDLDDHSVEYVVTTDKLNKRSGPSTSYPIVGYYTKGVTIVATETNGDWLKTDAGWINKTYLRKM